MTEKKENARAAVTAFTEDHFQAIADRLADRQRSEGLIRWYIAEVVNRTEPLALTDDDVAEGLVDKSGDLGADFLHRDEEGNVLIIQAKFRGQGKKEKPEDIARFADIVARLRDKDWIKKAHRKVREFADEIDWATDKFDLRYIACAAIEGQADLERRKSEERINSEEDLAITLRYFSETELNTEYRNAIRFVQGLPSQQKFYIAKDSVVIELPGEKQSCVMVVEGKQLAQLYEHAKDALFSLNIRAFLGATKINKEIAKTIKETPKQFYYYNNGITCLATELVVQKREVTVNGLQIINGAQTVRALAKASKIKDGSIDDVLVLVRITVQGEGYGAEGRFIENIVRFNNSQNAMKPADFVSNDPIQLSLKQQFAKYKRFGRDVVYLSKRAEKETSAKEFIPLEGFAKHIYSFLFDPIKFATGSAFFFESGREKGYYRVFGDGEAAYNPPMPDEEFRLRSAIWWMSQEFEIAVKSDKASGKYGAALERKNFLLYAARLILERNYGEDYKQILCKHYKGDWRLSDGSKAGRFFTLLYETARDVVHYQFKKDEEDQGDAFNQRNWMRSARTEQSITTYCTTAPGLNVLKGFEQ